MIFGWMLVWEAGRIHFVSALRSLEARCRDRALRSRVGDRTRPAYSVHILERFIGLW